MRLGEPRGPERTQPTSRTSFATARADTRAADGQSQVSSAVTVPVGYASWTHDLRGHMIPVSARQRRMT